MVLEWVRTTKATCTASSSEPEGLLQGVASEGRPWKAGLRPLTVSALSGGDDPGVSRPGLASRL